MPNIKEKISKILPKNSFIRSVSVLVGGTATAQVISILASPVLTRLYTTEDFGLLAVYGSIIGIVGVIASLRYELAIPIAETDKEAASLVYLSGIILIAVSITTGIVFYAFSSQLLGVLKASALKPFLWLLPLSVFFMGLYNILNYWAIRTKQFGVIARTKFTQSFSSVAVQLSAFKLGAIALLFGQLMGQTAGNTSLFTSTIKPHKETFKEVKKGDIVNSAKRWKKFPLFSTWAVLFNTAGTQLPPLLFATLFSPSIAGVYLLTNRVLQLPMTLIGGAIAQVFFSKSAEAHRKNELGVLVNSIHDKLAFIGMPVMLGIAIVGKQLFTFVFGSQWILAGSFAQWMSIWLYVVFVTSPITQVASIVEKQEKGLIFNIAQFVGRIVALIIGAYFDSVILAIILYSLVNALQAFAMLIWINVIINNPIKNIFISNFKALLFAVFTCLPLFLYMIFFQEKVILLLLSILITALLYIVTLFLRFKEIL